jgi:hypothetical protein
MKKFTLTAGLLCVISCAAAASGTVDVHRAGDDKTLTLNNADHLADLVAQPRLAGSWWRGAVIAEQQATVVAERQHQEMLTALNAAAMEESGADASAINALRQQLLAVKVTGRQFVALDPDEVRVGEGKNPPLQGKYTLWVGNEPSTITVLGLVNRPGNVAFSPGQDVAGYLKGIERLSGAERSYAWVIYPDGRTVKAPVAYWNKRHIEPMPGSIVFVGFADSLWTKKYDELNVAILRSLSQRIPE